MNSSSLTRRRAVALGFASDRSWGPNPFYNRETTSRRREPLGSALEFSSKLRTLGSNLNLTAALELRAGVFLVEVLNASFDR